MDPSQARGHPSHPKPTVLSDFILGSQDGIVNVRGIILGLSAATRDVRIILVATLAALGAESIAMGADDAITFKTFSDDVLRGTIRRNRRRGLFHRKRPPGKSGLRWMPSRKKGAKGTTSRL
jgi:VIT family protein